MNRCHILSGLFAPACLLFFVHLTWDNTDAFPVNFVRLDTPRPTAMAICYIDDVTKINYKINQKENAICSNIDI